MPQEPVESDYLRFSPYVHPSVMFRAEIFDDNAGYLESEETLRCEDYEIFMRLWERGLKGYNLPDILFCYREDQQSYRKRTLHARFNEAKLRFRNFRKMGILFPFGWLYVIRPMAGALLPPGLIGLLKRSEGMRVKREEKDGGSLQEEAGTIYAVPQYTCPDAAAQQSLARMQ